MLFAHDTTAALHAAAYLVNDDGIKEPADLDVFMESHEFVPAPISTPADVEAVAVLRSRLRAMWVITDIWQLAASINDLLADSNTRPWLTNHEPGYGWHFHVTSADASAANRITAQVAFALADLLRMGEIARLRECAAPGCDAVLVDLSKNRSRMYCDTGNCGNRQHVAAYRARRRTDDTDG